MVDIITLMASTPHRLLACVLLLVQAMATLGAGQTICIPLEDCVHRLTGVESVHGHDHHHDHGHHDHDHGACAHSTPPAAHHCCGHHACDSTPAPSEHATADLDCGCHLHLPIPERVDPLPASVIALPVILLPTTICRIERPCEPIAAGVTSSFVAADAWLGSAEVRSRDVTSLRV